MAGAPPDPGVAATETALRAWDRQCRYPPARRRSPAPPAPPPVALPPCPVPATKPSARPQVWLRTGTDARVAGGGGLDIPTSPALAKLEAVELELVNGIVREGAADKDGGETVKDRGKPKPPPLQRKREYAELAFGFLRVENPVRRLCITLSEHPLFEAIVIVVILVNCVFLAMMEPTKGDEEGRNALVNSTEGVFTGLFLAELVIKVVAMGFFLDDLSYMRDGWNIMDFIVVAASLVALFPGVTNVSSIRTMRVLRPLRTVTVLPGIRVLVSAMLESLPMMANVVLCLLFLFILFGILGMSLFMGVLRNRCHEVDIVDGVEIFTVADEENTCTSKIRMGFGGRLCPEGQICMPYENPNFGITSFDNFLWSVVTIFQCITLEGWTPIMYWTMDATTVWSFLYFVVLIWVGGFFVLQLALAVVTDSYADMAEDEAERQAEEKLEVDEEQEKNEMKKKYSMAVAESEKQMFAGLGGDQEGISLSGIFRAIVEKRWFSPTIFFLIFANTVVLSMEYAEMSPMYETVLDTVNLSLTIVFAVEAVLKIVGLGITEYSADKWNMFDLFVVAVSLVEIAMGNAGSIMSAFRALRILRVVKLIRGWTSLQKFLLQVFKTVMELGNFLLIVLITIFIFALLGMQLFGGKFDFPDEGVPRHNFDTLIWSIVTVFQILTGEDWNAVMYDGVRATNSLATLYFLLLLVVGNFIVVNLFVAILLSSFSEKVEDLPSDFAIFRQTMNQTEGLKDGLIDTYMASKMGFDDHLTTAEEKELARQRKEEEDWDRWVDGRDAKLVDKWVSLSDSLLDRLYEKLSREAQAADTPGSPASKASLQIQLAGESPGGLSCATEEHEEEEIASWKGNLPMRLSEYDSKALGLFDKSSLLRQICYSMVDDKRFEFVVMLCIVLSSITMTLESPSTLEDENFTGILFIVDCCFTAIFTLEMIIKLVALGFSMSPGTYTTDGWNIMDGFIVLLSLVELVLSQTAGASFGWVRSLRTIRVLRPLRAISRIPELKVVVNALFKSLPGLGNVIILAALVWLIFGILGMQMFMGKFGFCEQSECCPLSDDFGNPLLDSCVEVVTRAHCTGISPEGDECSWGTKDMNFDNIFKSMQTLFEMSTTEGWTAVMYDGVDAVGIDMQPVENHSVGTIAFFLVFMIVGSFFVLNLFIGVVLDNFLQVSSEESQGADSGKGNVSSLFLTRNQRNWVHTHVLALKMKAKPIKLYPDNRFRLRVYELVEHPKFEMTIMAAIALNVVVMATQQYDQSKAWDDFQHIANILFVVIFLAEAVLKLFAMYPAVYFSSKWNLFDFVVVAASLFGLFSGGSGEVSLLRIFRLARLFRIFRRLKGLMLLLKTFMASIPALINIGALLLLICFVYAILGVNLFGKIKAGENITDHANFRNFGSAMLTLLRMSTGEAWNGIMYDCMINQDCDSSSDCARGECCGTQVAPLYFISFVVIGSFVVLNLLIAVVLDNFSMAKDEAEKGITSDDLRVFRKTWSRFDPQGIGFVKAKEAGNLILYMSPPMGLEGTNPSPEDVRRFLDGVELKVSSNYIYYHDFKNALIAKAMGVNMSDMPEEMTSEIARSMEKTRYLAFKRAQELMPPDEKLRMQTSLDKEYDVVDYHLLVRLQGLVRGALLRKRLRKLLHTRQMATQVNTAVGIARHISVLLQATQKPEAKAAPAEKPSEGQQKRYSRLDSRPGSRRDSSPYDESD